jgi:hypothetical protein
MSPQLQRVLFSFWRFINGNKEAERLFFGVIFFGPAGDALWRLFRMPKLALRSPNTKHTGSIQEKRRRRNVCILGGGLILINMVSFVLYLRVWFLMPNNPTQFPVEHHVAALWMCCVVGFLLTLILLAIFEFKYGKINPKS